MASSQRIEMHCHTVFSPDAWRTPEEVVENAAERGVHTLSITDHNHLGAQARAAEHAATIGVRYVPGVEIDAIAPDGRNYHFVCFDYDLESVDFARLATQKSELYPLQFLELQRYFRDFGIELTVGEMEEKLAQRYPTNPSANVNQWFARDLLLEKQLLPDKAAFGRFVREIHQKMNAEGRSQLWPSLPFEAMLDAAHKAGGKVLLAHVSRYLPGQMDEQLALIEELLQHGMDGFELYHPDNVRENDFHRLYDMAKNTDCLLSGGSDCHDALSENRNQHFGNMVVEDWVMERLVAK